MLPSITIKTGSVKTGKSGGNCGKVFLNGVNDCQLGSDLSQKTFAGGRGEINITYHAKLALKA